MIGMLNNTNSFKSAIMEIAVILISILVILGVITLFTHHVTKAEMKPEQISKVDGYMNTISKYIPGTIKETGSLYAIKQFLVPMSGRVQTKPELQLNQLLEQIGITSEFKNETGAALANKNWQAAYNNLVILQTTVAKIKSSMPDDSENSLIIKYLSAIIDNAVIAVKKKVIKGGDSLPIIDIPKKQNYLKENFTSDAFYYNQNIPHHYGEVSDAYLKKEYMDWRKPGIPFNQLGGCSPQGLRNLNFTYPNIDPFTHNGFNYY